MALRSHRAGLAVVLLLLTAPLAGHLLAADPPAYVLEDLGSLGGDTLARAINLSGEAAGYGALSDGTLRAFVTTPGGAMQQLPTLGGTAAQAFGLNDGGWVVGAAQTTGGRYHAFRAAPDGVPQDLGTLGGSASFAYGLNESGAVVGYSATAASVNHAFRFTDGGGLEDLGTLGGPHSYAWAINESGVIVGQSYLADRTVHGFVWSAGVMTDVGTFGGRQSNVAAVNDEGVAVGAAMDAGGYWRAFRKAAGQPLTDLGTLGGHSSSAEAVNGNGDIVGWAETAGGQTHAFIWTAATGLVDLNSLVDPAQGWVLAVAYGVNDVGQITGMGLVGSQRRAFRLTPVHPVDSTPPVITMVTATPAVLDVPNHRMVDVVVTAASTDDSGAVPACVITDVTSSEPDNGLGDGDQAGDIVRTGPLSVQLRAERSGMGNGRAYTLTVMCTDDAGNSTSATAAVIVPRGAVPKPKR